MQEDAQSAFVVQRRLSPTDYHRVCLPVTGRLRRVLWLGKTLYGCTVRRFCISDPEYAVCEMLIEKKSWRQGFQRWTAIVMG